MAEMGAVEVAGELRKLSQAISLSIRGHVGTSCRSDAALADMAADLIGRLNHEIERLRASLSRAEEAIAPFRAIAVERYPYRKGDVTIPDHLPDDSNVRPIPYGMIRALVQSVCLAGEVTEETKNG